MRAVMRQMVSGAAARMTRLLAGSQWLASLYYAVGTRTFGREHRAVLAGRHEYLERGGASSRRFLLRRNVHMLEKGLSMRPLRPVFAIGYIEETVTCYRTLVGEIVGAQETDRELQWANDVLSTYFDSADGHEVIERARDQFVKAPLGIDERSTTPGLSPYERDLSGPPPVEFAELLALTERRRSVRWFEQRPVPREDIHKAIRVAGLSPSACNRQPYQFRVFDDREAIENIAAVPMGTRGWVHNIPTFVVIVGTLSAFFSERDRHLIYTDGCLAAMSFVLALESLGLSSCCVNWPDIEEREARMAELLGLETHERPVMCIAVGYPDPAGMVPFSHKRPPHEIVRFNFEEIQ